MLHVNRILLTAIIYFGICFGFSTASAETPVVWSYRYVFVSSSADQQITPLLADIELNHFSETAMLDLLAETLWTRSSESSLAHDDAKLIVGILSKSGGARYRSIVGETIPIMQFSDVQATAKSYTKKHEKDSREQYIRGTINFVELRKKYIDDAWSAKPTVEKVKLLEKLNRDTTIDDVVSGMGYPQFVTSAETRFTDYVLVHISVPRLIFYYRGIGRVVFDYDKKKGWHVRNTVIDPIAFEDLMPYRVKSTSLGLIGDSELDMTKLVSNRPSSIRLVAEKYYYRTNPPLEFLDTAAEILVTAHSTANTPVDVDAHAWICRLLAHQGGPRYSRVLSKVSTTTADKKLSRYAATPIEKVADLTTEEYRQGSISLAEQRLKYKTLYPEIVSGL